jgi:hypothetical protein
VPVAGSGFDGSGGEIRANAQPAGAEKFRSALGVSLKVNFAGTTHYIHWIRERFSQAEFMHNEMMSDPDKQKICFRLDRMTKQLNLLTNKYAMHELQACEKIVRHILTNRW